MTRDDPTHVSPYLSWAFNPASIICLIWPFNRVLHSGLEHLWREAHANIFM